MCGIVGLRLKNPEFESKLGALVVPMLDVLASRGPDSTGVAIYSGDVGADTAAGPGGHGDGSRIIGRLAHSDQTLVKYSLFAADEHFDWGRYEEGLTRQLGAPVRLIVRGGHAVAVAPGRSTDVLAVLRQVGPEVRVFGYGSNIEVYKDVGPALEVCNRYGIGARTGYQAIGHTRMATESAVTTEHSHPFAVAPDLALVHNGSFSNYASVRRDLVDEGVVFDTDNDSEVAARFIAKEMAEGVDLSDALRTVSKVFDGFFTLLVGTKDSIAVVRDSFACKPMVVAETPDYVAVASEYVALADLPGIEKAEVFEPMPEEIYTW